VLAPFGLGRMFSELGKLESVAEDVLVDCLLGALGGSSSSSLLNVRSMT